MKKIILPLLLLSALTASAQSLNTCRSIAERLLATCGTHDVAWLDSVLADDFTLNGSQAQYSPGELKHALPGLPVVSMDTIQLEKKRRTFRGRSLTYNTFGNSHMQVQFNHKGLITHIEWNAFFTTSKVISRATPSLSGMQPVARVQCDTLNGLLVVPVMVNGMQYRFLFDTGAGLTILNSSIFQPDTMGTTPSLGSISGTQERALGFMHIDSLSFFGVTVRDHDYVTQTMGTSDSIQLDSTRQEADGILGCDILMNFDILVDYDNLTLQLFNPQFTSQIVAAFKAQGIETHTVPFTQTNHVPLFRGKVGGEECQMGFDSGAGANVVNIAKPNLAQLVTVTDSVMVLGGGGANIMPVGTADYAIGDLSFPDCETVVTDTQHLGLDALVGVAIMKGHKILLAYSRKELIIF